MIDHRHSGVVYPTSSFYIVLSTKRLHSCLLSSLILFTVLELIRWYPRQCRLDNIKLTWQSWLIHYSLLVDVLLPHFSNVRVIGELLLLGDHSLTGHEQGLLALDRGADLSLLLLLLLLLLDILLLLLLIGLVFVRITWGTLGIIFNAHTKTKMNSKGVRMTIDDTRVKKLK